MTRSRSPRSKLHSAGGRPWLGWLFSLGLVALVILAGLTVYLDALVQNKFSGRRWTLPAKVYARPLELYAGQRLSKEDFLQELKVLGYRWGPGVARPGDFSALGDHVDLHTRGFDSYEGSEVSQAVRVRFNGNTVAGLSAPNGTAVPLARLEPMIIGGIYPSQQEDRILVKLDQVPAPMVATLVAVEDRDFFDHHGVSVKSVFRAIWVNATAGSVVQGGSTLTQQLVKNFYLSNERSLLRKATEAIMAVLLEFHYEKKDILEAYLNEVFLGQDGSRAIHGFGLASQYFFGQPLSELQLHQVALLVGMVKGPTYYNPRLHPDRALARRNLVLDVLAEQGVASTEEVAEAKQRPLDVSSQGNMFNGAFPAFLDLVKRQLRETYPEEELTGEGLRVFTSFDPIKQWKAEAALSDAFKQASRPGADRTEAALLVVDTSNGEIQALIGGRRSGFAGFNRALDAVRPIGSLIKPAIYLTALQQPNRYTLSSIIKDEPLTVKGANGQPWSPQNFDHKAHGDILLYQGLAHSYNLASVQLGLQVGVPNVLKTLNKMGMQRDWPSFPAMLLGAGALSPLEVATLYQSIASGGFHTPLRSIRSVLSVDGKPLKHYPLEVRQTLDPKAVFLVQNAMQQVLREGTGRAVYQELPASVVLAGKTGTTNDSRDSWFAGFSQDQLAVVWVGRDDNGVTPFTGATGALRIWTKYMSRVYPLSLANSPPQGVQFAWVDGHTGQGSSQDCQSALRLPYIRGSEPAPGASCEQSPAPQGGLLDWVRGLGH